ncbi:unnamed protein product, partial [Laminaria digitata]
RVESSACLAPASVSLELSTASDNTDRRVARIAERVNMAARLEMLAAATAAEQARCAFSSAIDRRSRGIPAPWKGAMTDGVAGGSGGGSVGGGGRGGLVREDHQRRGQRQFSWGFEIESELDELDRVAAVVAETEKRSIMASRGGGGGGPRVPSHLAADYWQRPVVAAAAAAAVAAATGTATGTATTAEISTMAAVKEAAGAPGKRARGPSGGARPNKPLAAAAYDGDHFTASVHAGSARRGFTGRASRGPKTPGRVPPPGGYDFASSRSSASQGFGAAAAAAAATAAAAASSNASSRRVFDAPRVRHGGGDDRRDTAAYMNNNKPGYLFGNYFAVMDGAGGINGDIVNTAPPQRRPYAPTSTSTSGFRRRAKKAAGPAAGSRPQKKTKRKSQGGGGGGGASAAATRHVHGGDSCA